MRYITLALLFFCQGNVSAAELTPEQATHTYAIAYGQAGFIPEKAPTIHLVNRVKLCRIAGLNEACRARGLTDADGVIYLDDTLDFSQPLDASILLHEMVHYVDWAKDGPGTSCEEWVRRERRAYTIQGHALEKVGVDPTPVYMALRMMGCQNPR